jgi:1-acyl-sn-glycerol-3-phosphate acyltransferase
MRMTPERSHDEAAVARELATLSVTEIVDAAGARGAPQIARRLVSMLARVPSDRLGASLARFDADVPALGVAAAARALLRRFGAALEIEGALPRAGAALVVTNHPGAYDSIAMLAAAGRDDVALVAAERTFLSAMPRFRAHLVFVTDSRTKDNVMGRAAGLRRALSWLDAGHVLVQYGAGAIEPDARFARPGEDVLGVWPSGTGVLAAHAAKRGASVVPALVSGVHSRRAKALPMVRWAERRGVTTIAPLIQATVPGFRDVEISVRFGTPVDRGELLAARAPFEQTALVRAAVARLANGVRSSR